MKQCKTLVLVWLATSIVGIGFYYNKICKQVAKPVFKWLKT